MKKLIIISIVVVVISIVALPAMIFADPVERVQTFVCPVLNENAGMNNPNAFPIAGGDYSLLPGKAGDPANSPVMVPVHATNQNGNGGPGGSHAGPGDADYSPIWNQD